MILIFSILCSILFNVNFWKRKLIFNIIYKFISFNWKQNLYPQEYKLDKINNSDFFSFKLHRYFLYQNIYIYAKGKEKYTANFIVLGLPWWCSGWESACQCRGHRFEPWSGRIPHAAEQLGPWATTTEPVRLEPVLRKKRGRDSERPAHRDEEWPLLAATRESPRTETKTQHSQK